MRRDGPCGSEEEIGDGDTVCATLGTVFQGADDLSGIAPYADGYDEIVGGHVEQSDVERRRLYRQQRDLRDQEAERIMEVMRGAERPTGADDVDAAFAFDDALWKVGDRVSCLLLGFGGEVLQTT